PRLRLRYRVLIVAGTYILVELLGELLLQGSASGAIAERIHAVAVMTILFAVAFAVLRTAPHVLKPAPGGIESATAHPALLDRLKQLVEVQQVYRREGLTIGALAERLGVPEHKLRALINAQLGFKNFNAFLHHYRIRDAQQALTDPERAHQGIAQIAYE